MVCKLEFILMVGVGTTSISIVSVLKQKPEPTSYTTVVIPNETKAGSKVPALIPLPVQLPPMGEPPSTIGLALTHIVILFPALAFTKLVTVAIIVSAFIQPFISVMEYIRFQIPLPAKEGLKPLAFTIPVPDHMPFRGKFGRRFMVSIISHNCKSNPASTALG